MKKLLAIIMVLAAALTLFAACGETEPSDGAETPDIPGAADDTVTGGAVEPVDFIAHIVRTDGYVDGEVYPIITVISSRDELDAYVERYRDVYSFGTEVFAAHDSSLYFSQLLGPYTDEFFADNYVVMLILEEPSGSIRHEVDGVYTDGEIVIKRLLPGIGTDDMAEWHVIIDLGRDFQPPDGFTVSFVDEEV